MADKVTYKGLEIEAAPYKLQDGGWSHDGYIREHKGGSITDSHIRGDGSSETKAEAVRFILALGKQLVDDRS